MATAKIGIIRGDGIGPELIDAALTVLDAVAATGGPTLETVEIDAGADTYRRTGTAMAPSDLETIRGLDAALKGPVGLPDVRQPDGTEGGLLGGIMRTGLDAYANVRPVRLFDGVDAPLKSTDAGIDYVIVRENTEGLYASRGKGVGNQWAVTDTSIMTREGTLRVVRLAFELALRRPGAPSDGAPRVTCVDKSNVLAATPCSAILLRGRGRLSRHRGRVPLCRRGRAGAGAAPGRLRRAGDGELPRRHPQRPRRRHGRRRLALPVRQHR